MSYPPLWVVDNLWVSAMWITKIVDKWITLVDNFDYQQSNISITIALFRLIHLL